MLFLNSSFDSDMIWLFASLVSIPKNLVKSFEIRGVSLHVEQRAVDAGRPNAGARRSQTKK